MVAKSVSLYQNDDVSLKPYSLFGLVSLSYVGAMVASNGALAYISYPTQVLGKSAKPIPVMILGVVINKKSYPFIKYICVLMIVFGVASFMYKDHPSHSNFSFMSGSSIISIFSSIGIGEVLVVSGRKKNFIYYNL
jgi:UDP-galactose transporter B1